VSETKDISLLPLGAAFAPAIARVQSHQAKQARWAALYAVLAAALAGWGLWPPIGPALGRVLDLKKPPCAEVLRRPPLRSNKR
jgi:hypothetical protein